MNRILNLLTSVFAIAVISGCSKDNSVFGTDSSKIIGGTVVEETDPILLSTVAINGEVAGGIGQENEFYTCTGTLIAHDVVVTAAHCAYDQSVELTVVFGTQNSPDSAPFISFVDEVRIHPSYSVIRTILDKPVENRSIEEKKLLFNGWSDIAVLKLQTPAPASFQIATLLDATLATGDEIVLAGYGISKIADGLETDDGLLRKVALPIFKDDFNPSEYLIDQRKDRGSCRGDSGGPAYVIKNGVVALAGVSSHGIMNVKTCNGFSTVTKINAFSSWLKEQLNSFIN